MQAQPPNRLPSGQLTALAAAALDGAADLIGFLDIEGKVLYANRAACEEVQLPRELVLQATIFDFLPSASPEMWGAQWQEFRKGGRMRFVDWMRRRDGTLFPVDVQASLVQYDGVEVALGRGRGRGEGGAVCPHRRRRSRPCRRRRRGRGRGRKRSSRDSGDAALPLLLRKLLGRGPPRPVHREPEHLGRSQRRVEGRNEQK